MPRSLVTAACLILFLAPVTAQDPFGADPFGGGAADPFGGGGAAADPFGGNPFGGDPSVVTHLGSLLRKRNRQRSQIRHGKSPRVLSTQRFISGSR